jgi:hypothetical protein
MAKPSHRRSSLGYTSSVSSSILKASSSSLALPNAYTADPASRATAFDPICVYNRFSLAWDESDRNIIDRQSAVGLSTPPLLF